MIENFNRSESWQDGLEITNAYLLKGTKDNCQYCEYVHKRKKENCPAFGKMYRKCVKKNYFQTKQSQKERHWECHSKAMRRWKWERNIFVKRKEHFNAS